VNIYASNNNCNQDFVKPLTLRVFMFSFWHIRSAGETISSTEDRAVAVRTDWKGERDWTLQIQTQIEGGRIGARETWAGGRSYDVVTRGGQSEVHEEGGYQSVRWS